MSFICTGELPSVRAKPEKELTFWQIRDGLVRFEVVHSILGKFRIISISSKLFGYPGCL